MTRQNAAITALTNLLHQQREALLTGDLRRLDTLAAPLERAMAQLMETRPDGRVLSGLTRLAARNTRLLASAQEGLARARRDPPAPHMLTTYDATGRQQSPTAAGQLISRR